MKYDFLRNVPLFAALPGDDLERLCMDAEEVELEEGQHLFSEGDMGEMAYVIKDGEVEIVKESSGRDVLLAVRGPGEVIGEMALLESRPRMASVRARTPTTLVGIRKEQMDGLLATSLSAATTMFYTVLGRWRNSGIRSALPAFQRAGGARGGAGTAAASTPSRAQGKARGG
jgi:CRP-like cAMP-binding protein